MTQVQIIERRDNGWVFLAVASLSSIAPPPPLPFIFSVTPFRCSFSHLSPVPLDVGVSGAHLLHVQCTIRRSYFMSGRCHRGKGCLFMHDHEARDKARLEAGGAVGNAADGTPFAKLTKAEQTAT